MDGSRGSFCLALQLPAVDDDDGGGVSLQRRCVRARGVERRKGMTTLQFIVYICRTGDRVSACDKNLKKVKIIFKFPRSPHFGIGLHLFFDGENNLRAAARQSSAIFVQAFP